MSALYQVTPKKQGSFDVFELRDDRQDVSCLICPAAGNFIFSLLKGGQEFIFCQSLEAYAAERPLSGIPFLAPWANRISGNAYSFQDKTYALDPSLGNLRLDPHGQASHGLLLKTSLWELEQAVAGESGAQLVTRLDFSKVEGGLEQFPFDHRYRTIFRLERGALTVQTSVTNTGTGDMPVAFGYHPYFSLRGAGRAQWAVTIPAGHLRKLNVNFVPTGELEARETLARGEWVNVGDTVLDHAFTDLSRDSQGYCRFALRGPGRSLDVDFGPAYSESILFSPAGKEFLCIEPMTAPTDAFNLRARGLYPELKVIGPGQSLQADFRMTPLLP